MPLTNQHTGNLLHQAKNWTAVFFIFAGSKAGAATVNGGIILAAASTSSFTTSMSAAVGIINTIIGVLAFAALASSVIMYMMGARK